MSRTGRATEIERLVIPARVVATGIDSVDLPGAVISTTTAARLGVPPGNTGRYFIRLGHPVREEDLARAAAIVAGYPDGWADAALGPTRSGDGFRIAMLIASLLFALSVTGVAVALGEAESRPEQRTLLALGADPRVRRRIAAGRAAVISLLAGVLAVPAGLLPIWGLLLSRGARHWSCPCRRSWPPSWSCRSWWSLRRSSSRARSRPGPPSAARDRNGHSSKRRPFCPGDQGSCRTADAKRFDAIVRADGLHSAVRELVFGPATQFEHFLDAYVAAYRGADYPHVNPGWYVAHSIQKPMGGADSSGSTG